MAVNNLDEQDLKVQTFSYKISKFIGMFAMIKKKIN